MTGGVTVVLGRVGDNFAAGMTGGMAFVYDPDQVLPERVNPDTVVFQRLERFAERLLIHWAQECGHFWQVVPKEMLERLEHPVTLAGERKRA
jgi:glutamate synthase (NADPH/NADH) large chain